MRITKVLFQGRKVSPIIPDRDLVKKKDKDGNEVITFEDSLRTPLGKASDMTIEKQIKAGVKLSQSVRISSATRLDGLARVEQIARDLDASMPKQN